MPGKHDSKIRGSMRKSEYRHNIMPPVDRYVDPGSEDIEQWKKDHPITVDDLTGDIWFDIRDKANLTAKKVLSNQQ